MPLQVVHTVTHFQSTHCGLRLPLNQDPTAAEQAEGIDGRAARHEPPELVRLEAVRRRRKVGTLLTLTLR